MAQAVRSDFIPILPKYLTSSLSFNRFERELLEQAKQVHLFRKNHPDILFTRADKDNVTVVFDRLSYISSINNMLNDSSTYARLNKNLIKTSENELNKLLNIESQKSLLIT